MADINKRKASFMSEKMPIVLSELQTIGGFFPFLKFFTIECVMLESKWEKLLINNSIFNFSPFNFSTNVFKSLCFILIHLINKQKGAFLHNLYNMIVETNGLIQLNIGIHIIVGYMQE